MGKLETRRQINLMIILSVGVYFFSYLTRINYTAIIVELIDKSILTKPQAAIVTTVAFITYGVGQLLSGFIGDRISPRWLIFYGFIATISMNFLMPVCSKNVLLLTTVWGINGVAQAFMWPPLVKIMTAALTDSEYMRAVSFIGIGSSAATIIIYLFSPFIITLFGWQYVFYIFGGLSLIAAFLWIFITGRLLKNVEIKLGKSRKTELQVSDGNSSEVKLAKYLTGLLPVILLTIALQGVLRDGITTWTPSFMSENFKIEPSKSIFTAIGAPVFHVFINIVTYKILKILKNDIFKALTIYYLASTVFLFILRAFSMNSAVLSVIVISSATGVVHGINLLQTGYIPKYFVCIGSVSTISGILNFSTYIGSAISTYLFAIISDSFGWGITVISWVGFSLLGLAINYLLWKCVQKHSSASKVKA